jgi:hypothetical protein
LLPFVFGSAIGSSIHESESFQLYVDRIVDLAGRLIGELDADVPLGCKNVADLKLWTAT